MPLRPFAALLLALVAACAPPSAPAVAPSGEAPLVTLATATTDSIVLERTACYRSCPQYRVRLSGKGEVAYSAPPMVVPGKVVSAFGRTDVPAGAVARLAREAEAMGFWTLPARVQDVPELCGPRATDHATAVISIHTAGGSHEVAQYLGCHGTRPELRALRELAMRIDSVAGTASWVGR